MTILYTHHPLIAQRRIQSNKPYLHAHNTKNSGFFNPEFLLNFFMEKLKLNYLSAPTLVGLLDTALEATAVFSTFNFALKAVAGLVILLITS